MPEHGKAARHLLAPAQHYSSAHVKRIGLQHLEILSEDVIPEERHARGAIALEGALVFVQHEPAAVNHLKGAVLRGFVGGGAWLKPGKRAPLPIAGEEG